MKTLVTGGAGFIGFHVTRALLQRGDAVVNFDNVNDYYEVTLKEARLRELDKVANQADGSYEFVRANLADRTAVESIFSRHQFDRVINLAAQAGVRYSFKDPYAYAESNVTGFLNLIECCRHARTPHLVYASTSSVYGANRDLPYSEHRGANHPLQFYAATKRMNELTAHAYSHLFGLPTTGLRFFTVYGPWGRPDMAPAIFVRAILKGEPIQLFNNGNHTRDFTFVDDIVEGVIRASDRIAAPNWDWDPHHPDPQSSSAPFRILNIGGGQPEPIIEFVRAIEAATGCTAKIEYKPIQPGDAQDTTADFSELEKLTGFRPTTSTRDGVKSYVEWYKYYYNC